MSASDMRGARVDACEVEDDGPDAMAEGCAAVEAVLEVGGGAWTASHCFLFIMASDDKLKQWADVLVIRVSEVISGRGQSCACNLFPAEIMHIDRFGRSRILYVFGKRF